MQRRCNVAQARDAAVRRGSAHDARDQPSQRSLCNHRFVVDCGKPSVVAIFLLPMPAVAIFSMAKSSYADRTILAAKRFTSTCVSEYIWLWYMDVLSLAWVLCIDVKFAKTWCFITHFLTEWIFHQKGPKIDMNIFYYGLPSPYHDSSEKLHIYT